MSLWYQSPTPTAEPVEGAVASSGARASVTIYAGDALEELRALSSESVHCCVTSPPYWGLRDYGTGTWEGGDPACDHLRPAAHGYDPFKTSTLGPNRDGISTANSAHADEAKRQQYKDVCGKCRAVRVDKQIGLEKTPEEYIAKMVEVFREVRRVLRADGTLWLNMGDAYESGTRASRDYSKNVKHGYWNNPAINLRVSAGLKAKDLIGLPWLLAFALRADGWFLRQDIIWHKPNPMPESVRDRCTKAHEYLFLLSKSERYYWDQEAVKEDCVKGAAGPKFNKGKTAEHQLNRTSDLERSESPRRNRRSVWTIPTSPFPEAHFATFPPSLVEPCILAGAPAAGIVLDPFAGSGTTLMVARRLGRASIGIELQPSYLEMIRRRVEAGR